MSRFLGMIRQFTRAHQPLPVPIESFDPTGDRNTSEIVRLRLRRPILLGSLVVLVLVFGLLTWAALAPVAGAVVAAGSVRVENNSKTLRYREGGIVRRILVREGDRVRRGQELMRFDPVQTEASKDVWQSVYDTALANVARFQAMAANAREVNFPQELLQRQNEPQVAALLVSQRGLFATTMSLYSSQSMVLANQVQQLQTQIQGLQAQMQATDSQSDLINQELSDVRELDRQGYAPRSRLLALQRSAAAIKGQRGANLSDIGRARQAIGEVRLQLAQLSDRRETEAAQGLRDAQDKLTDAAPKLRATASSLGETVIRSPVDGYVFNLTQFTEGGVSQPGETLMQIVPVNAPLIITARIPPNDISDVRPGLPARITLTAYNSRTTPQIDGKVILVGADAQVDEASRQSYFLTEIQVDPKALEKAGPAVHLTPGMPASVAIRTSSRTILDYLLSPLTDAMRTSLRER